MNIEHLFVLALATWRISNLLVNEAGPFDVFEWLRAEFGIRWDIDKEEHFVLPVKDNVIGRILLCVYCTSMWVALFVWACFRLAPNIAFILALILAMSAITCLIDRYMES